MLQYMVSCIGGLSVLNDATGPSLWPSLDNIIEIPVHLCHSYKGTEYTSMHKS